MSVFDFFSAMVQAQGDKLAWANNRQFTRSAKRKSLSKAVQKRKRFGRLRNSADGSITNV